MNWNNIVKFWACDDDATELTFDRFAIGFTGGLSNVSNYAQKPVSDDVMDLILAQMKNVAEKADQVAQNIQNSRNIDNKKDAILTLDEAQTVWNDLSKGVRNEVPLQSIANWVKKSNNYTIEKKDLGYLNVALGGYSNQSTISKDLFYRSLAKELPPADNK